MKAGTGAADRAVRVVIVEPVPMLAALLASSLHGRAEVATHRGELETIVDVVESGCDVVVAGPTNERSVLLRVIPQLLSHGTRTLVVLSGPLQETDSAVLLAGASGLLLDIDTSPSQLADAVVQISAGTSALHPDVVHAVLADWRRQRTQQSSTSTTELTSRELDVLRGLRDGLTTRLLARRLNIAEKTVEAHKSRLFNKLGVRNQSQAVQSGSDLGLI